MTMMTDYWKFFKRAAAIGFIYGWLCGFFLALWAWFTLGL